MSTSTNESRTFFLPVTGVLTGLDTDALPDDQFNQPKGDSRNTLDRVFYPEGYNPSTAVGSPIGDLGVIDPVKLWSSTGNPNEDDFVLNLSVAAADGSPAVARFWVADPSGLTRFGPFELPIAPASPFQANTRYAIPILTGDRVFVEWATPPAAPGANIIANLTPAASSDLSVALMAAASSIKPVNSSADRLLDLSVNAAAIEVIAADLVLRAGARTNAAGAFNGGGTGNKAICGVVGFNGMPLGDLDTVEYVWTNLQGSGGPFFIPPGGPSTQTPYINLVVDFDPNGVGDVKILVTNDDSLNPAITNAIGTYSNNGSNVLTFSWNDTQDVLISGQVPPAPGGVAPNVSVGASWLENSYRFSDLVAANPDAVLVDVFTGDGGLPAGAITPSVLLASGDSGNVARTGKRVSTFTVNGQNLLVL